MIIGQATGIPALTMPYFPQDGSVARSKKTGTQAPVLYSKWLRIYLIRGLTLGKYNRIYYVYYTIALIYILDGYGGHAAVFILEDDLVAFHHDH